MFEKLNLIATLNIAIEKFRNINLSISQNSYPKKVGLH